MTDTKQQYVCKKDGATIHVYIGEDDFGRGKVELTRAEVYSAGETIRGDLPPSFIERLEAGEEYANSIVALVQGEASDEARTQVEEAVASSQKRAAGFDPLSATLLELKEHMETATPEEKERVGQIMEDARLLEAYDTDDEDDDPLPPPVPVPSEFKEDGQGGNDEQPPENKVDAAASTEGQPAVDQGPGGDAQSNAPEAPAAPPEDAVDQALLEPADYNALKQPDLKERLDARKIEYPKGAVSNATLIKLLDADDKARAAANQEGEQNPS
jgi:hypothetical protein